MKLPDFELLARLQAEPALRRKPLVIVGEDRRRLAVVAASDDARAMGVTFGMALNQAEHCCPEAAFKPADPAAAASLLSRLLSALYAIAPQLGPDGRSAEVFIQLDGLNLRWPVRAALLEAIQQTTEQVTGACPAIGAGQNLFVAAIAAGQTRPGHPLTVEPAGTHDFLEPLSLEVLPLEEDIRFYLELLGLRTLGALRRISREAWRRQFGPDAMRLHELAFGIDPRPLPLWAPLHRVQESEPLDPPVESAEALQFVARALCQRVGEGLLGYGLGARRLLVLLEQDGGPRLEVEVRFAYPLTSAAEIFNSLRSRLLRAPVEAPLERITLRAGELEPAYVRQPGLLIRADGHKEALAEAVIRLQEEHGMHLVQRAAIVGGAPPIASRQFSWSPV